jgi:hypothetical protein
MTNAVTSDDSSRSTKKVVAWIARALAYLIYAYLIIVEIILILGFFLLLFGANPSSGFVDWAYRNLHRVMEPFEGIFSPIAITTTANDVPAVFETSVLFAMIVYGIFAILVSSAVHWLNRIVHRLDREEDEAERRKAYAEAIRQNTSPLDPTLPQMPPDPYGLQNPTDPQVPPPAAPVDTAPPPPPAPGAPTPPPS